VTAGVLLGLKEAALIAAEDIYLERSLSGNPHAGKVLAAIQPHSDDVPLLSAGTVAKLIQEGYIGHLIRATNDDMGRCAGAGHARERRPARPG
jgi:LmbE family N-acetylglucosaminyl deacetylase